MLLSVVIPCRDEKPNIARFAGELFPALDSLGVDYEVCAVDDGSADGSREALEDLAGRFPRLRVLAHPRNLGMGAALRTGFSQARGEWIATLDADLTFHPRQIRDLLERQRATGADMVAGSPFLTAAGAAAVPWKRKLPSLIINAFYRGCFSRAIGAYTPIFRLYRACALKAIPITSAGFEINAEIAARLALAGRTVAEAPAVLTERLAGVSKLSRFRELRRHAALILSLIRLPRAGRDASSPRGH